MTVPESERKKTRSNKYASRERTPIPERSTCCENRRDNRNPAKRVSTIEQMRGRILTDVLISGARTSQPEEATEREERRLRLKLASAVAWIPARAIAARTRAGEVIWILTTLDASALSALAIMGLYRLRWQIELLFKKAQIAATSRYSSLAGRAYC